MPTTISLYRYAGTGGLQTLPVPPYLDPGHISVLINGTPTTAWSWLNNNSITITAPSGSLVEIRRDTSPLARLVDYQSGLPLTESTMDSDSLQAFYLAQEARDAFLLATTTTVTRLTATPGQTVITPSAPYTPGKNAVALYVNGLREYDFTETNANAVTVAALAGGEDVLLVTGHAVSGPYPGLPQGPDKAVQFNDNGVPAGDSTLTFDKATKVLAVQKMLCGFAASTPATLTDAATIAVDASLSNNFRVVLGGNRTLGNPTNLTNGMVLNFYVKQDGSGGRTLGYSSKYKWPGGIAPSLSTAIGAIDLISCYYDSTDDALLCVMQKGFA